MFYFRLLVLTLRSQSLMDANALQLGAIAEDGPHEPQPGLSECSAHNTVTTSNMNSEGTSIEEIDGESSNKDARSALTTMDGTVVLSSLSNHDAKSNADPIAYISSWHRAYCHQQFNNWQSAVSKTGGARCERTMKHLCFASA